LNGEMRDPAVEALATDPRAKVTIFIDGQNLYKTCRSTFGHPLCHPHLLARHLAGPRDLVGCRFYTGHPNPNSDPVRSRNLDRRLSLMRGHGVTVVTRMLRYHWDWGWRGDDTALPSPGPDVPPRQVMLRPWLRPQEKGIDVTIALDVVEHLLTEQCDVAVIVSFDRDLYEIPQTIENLNPVIARPVRLEAAVPVRDGGGSFTTLPKFSYTHQINRRVFERVRDNTDYTVSNAMWAARRSRL
jgi:uncharacterized LabA/DUF88 family protein